MIPATPPPWARWPLAALTIASTGSSSRLPRTTWNMPPAPTGISTSIWPISERSLLDLRFCPEPADQLLDLRLDQLLLDSRIHFGERRAIYPAPLSGLYDM